MLVGCSMGTPFRRSDRDLRGDEPEREKGPCHPQCRRLYPRDPAPYGKRRQWRSQHPAPDVTVGESR